MQTSLYHHPENNTLQGKRFLLWLAIGSTVMMFAGFTSAYIVKKADASSWTQFTLPLQFYISTALILASSVFMFVARRGFSAGNLFRYRNFLLLTFLAGVGFLISQVSGWRTLVGEGIIINEEVSGAFFYVISGAHALHVTGGVIILLIALIRVSKRIKRAGRDDEETINPERMYRVDLTSIYWHFVDILWIYLFFFLLYNHT